MTPDDWKKIKEILADAAEMDSGARVAFLERNCPTELRTKVEELLNSASTNADLLDGDPTFLLNTDNLVKDRTGERIGPYEIVSELGAGGMGTVYLAKRADGEFEQKVALKLIKRGMDSDAIVGRFVNERQILASLDHPNIAHLIDGGTTDDGLPYFVMEFVEGESIIESADARGLDLDERLAIFRKVCSAVSFAHQNLVIHRDLKPSNILITKAGDVKLLDFGIAKLLRSDESERTATQNFVFTPEYASPEQVRGEQLTTATDIYSLGVILYELLTGSRPYKTDGRNLSEVIQAVCDTQPERPSSVVSLRGGNGAAATGNHRHTTGPSSRNQNPRSLRGDLDNIILKALRKEPERRYSSVEQFADDIKRHLEGLPVTASRDTWTYRAAKFARRNRIAVVGAALIIISLLTGISATLYQRNKAQARFNDVRGIANSFLFEFHDAIKDLPGSTPARELVVKRALEYLDKLSQESEGDKALLRELATAYAQIGLIQGNSYHSNLGDSDGAMKSYLRSLEIRQSLVSADPTNRELQHELADSHEGVGDMHYTVNELEKGLQSYESAVAIGERLIVDEPANLEFKYSLAGVLGKRGDISGMEGFPNLGDLPRALESYKRGVALFEELVNTAPTNDKYQLGYATMLNFYGMLQASTGDGAGSIASGRRSIAIFESLVAANPNNAKYETHLMAGLVFMRYPLVDEKLFDEALSNAKRVIRTMEKQLAADPKNAFFKRSVGVSYNALGRIQTDMGNGAAALENHHKALKFAEELFAVDPESSENQRDLAMTLEFTADAEANKGDCSAAIESYRKALKAYGSAPGDDVAASYSGLGKCLAAIGKINEAADSFRQTVPLAEKAAVKSPMNVKKQARLAIYYLEGGKVLARLAAASGGRNSALIQEKEQWLEKGYRMLKDLEVAGKLSKINSKHLTETENEMQKLGRLSQ